MGEREKACFYFSFFLSISNEIKTQFQTLRFKLICYEREREREREKERMNECRQ